MSKENFKSAILGENKQKIASSLTLLAMTLVRDKLL